MTNQLPRLLTYKQVGERLQLGVKSVKKLCEQRHLALKKFNKRKHRITSDSVERLIAQIERDSVAIRKSGPSRD